jgi:hypothetical protein
MFRRYISSISSGSENTHRYQSSRQTGRSDRPSLNNNFSRRHLCLPQDQAFEICIQEHLLLSEMFSVGPKELYAIQEVHFYI